MHEFSLYGQVPGSDHKRMLQQLAGVTRMQPKSVREIHLVFKSQTPSALQTSASKGDTTEQQQETQRVMRMLTTGLYFAQVVGKVLTEEHAEANGHISNGDVEMTNGQDSKSTDTLKVRWHVEFKDTPEAGKQTLSNRYSSSTAIEDGDIIGFMKKFGFDYVSRYMVVGDKFFDHDTTIFLHRVMQIPQADKLEDAMTLSFLEMPKDVQPLDGTGGCILQASIEAAEGTQEMKDRAASQLLVLKDTLKQAVTLTPGDRLALDTKFTAVRRG
jgi:Med18 protein